MRSRYGMQSRKRGPESLVLLVVGFVSLLAVSACQSPTDPWGGEVDPAIHDNAGKESPLARYRRALLGPGREHVNSTGRKTAIRALVSARTKEPHAILHEVIAASEDPGLAPMSTLEFIVETLGNQLAVDLDTLRAVQLAERLQIYAAYLDQFVELVAQQRAISDKLMRGIENFFAILPDKHTRYALERFVQAGSRGRQLEAVLRLAGATEDPPLAASLAPLLVLPEIKALVQDTLGRLTLRVLPFETLADFEAWEKKNHGRRFDELARRTAIERLEIQRSFEVRLEKMAQKNLAKLLRYVQQIFHLGLMQSPPPWTAFETMLKDAELEQVRGTVLESFYQELRARKLTSEKLQPDKADLARLLLWFQSGYEQAAQLPADPKKRTLQQKERTAWLSNLTYASFLLGGEETLEAEARLLDLLTSQEDDKDRVVELLTLFKRDKVRRRLLEHLEKKFATEAYALILVGVPALAELGNPDDRDLAKLQLAFLDKCVRCEALSMETRDHALDIMGDLGKAEVVPALQGLVNPGQGGVPEPLRLKALAWINTRVTTELQASSAVGIEARASAQLDFLLNCLVDASPRLRKEAGRQLEDFPPAVVNFKKQKLRWFAQQIVNETGRALRKEDDAGCIQQYRKVFLKQAQMAEVSDAAIENLVGALVEWSDFEKFKDPSARRTILYSHLSSLTDSLRQLLTGAGITQEATMQRAEKLVDARLSLPAETLLGSKLLMSLELAKRAGEGTPAERARAQQQRFLRKKRGTLVLTLVENLGDLERLSSSRRKEVNALITNSKVCLLEIAKEYPKVLVMLGEALLLNKTRYEEAAEVLAGFGTTIGTDAGLKLLTRARQIRAEALLMSGNAREASKILDGIGDPVSQRILAKVWLATSAYAKAEAIYKSLLENPTIPASGALREEFQLGFANGLRGQDKIPELSRYLRALPPFQESAFKRRRARLESEVARLMKERQKQGGTKSANPPGGGR